MQSSLAIGHPAALLAAGVSASGEGIDSLMSQLKDASPSVRARAWQGAWMQGAGGVQPLAELAATAENPEVARAARHAITNIVRHAGRPGHDSERHEVNAALVACLAAGYPDQLRRDLMSMLSEIGDEAVVDALREQLEDEAVREDARMALERIPGVASLQALRDALPGAPDAFKIQIAQSLRARGESVEGLPCVKMIPTKHTEVKP